ncbi:hypothetical protein VTO73DRAFT_12927 [Trametes versicolor]
MPDTLVGGRGAYAPAHQSHRAGSGPSCIYAGPEYREIPLSLTPSELKSAFAPASATATATAFANLPDSALTPSTTSITVSTSQKSSRTGTPPRVASPD